MKTLTITGVTVVGSAVTLTGVLSDTTFGSPAVQVSVPDSPVGNTKWWRVIRLSNQAVFCQRNGSNPAAITLPSIALIARALEPTLSWPPVISTQPVAVSCVHASTAAVFTVVAVSEDAASQTYLWQYADATVKATATISVLESTAPTDGDTVTIGNKIYTFKTALTLSTSPNEVLIGVSAATALDNLKAAVNRGTLVAGVGDGTGSGTLYGSETLQHTQVTATTNTDTTQLFEAIVAGEAANAYAVSTDSDHLSWATTTLVNGGWASAATGSPTPINGCQYTGYQTFQLTCTPTTTGQTGILHRCVVTNLSGIRYTDSVALTIT